MQSINLSNLVLGKTLRERKTLLSCYYNSVYTFWSKKHYCYSKRCVCVFVFLTICIDHETFSRIIHCLPKQNSSQSGFMSTIMNSTVSDNVQSPALNPVGLVWLWYVLEWDSQHESGGIVWPCESQWNVSNISWNPCNPLRLFLEQMEALPCINSVPNEVLWVYLLT